MEIVTIDELQEAVGLLDANKEKGIIYNAVYETSLYELLEKYIDIADNRMYYAYGERRLSRKFEQAYILENYSFIGRAIYYALMSNEYRLKTLIATTELEYNPIDNYVIHESIITSATISASNIKGEQENSHNVGKITITDSGTVDTDFGSIKETNHTETDYGAISETSSENTTYGKTTSNGTQSTDYGARSETGSDTQTKSVYNDTGYKPLEKHDTTNNKEEVTDTVTENNIINEHEDKVSTSKNITEHGDTSDNTRNINQHTDVKTTDMTKTQDAYETNDSIGQREDTENRKDDINKQRDVNGRYGHTSTQALIKEERDIADISIVEEIIKIVLGAITLNVVFID